MPTNVLVAYYSLHSHVEALARAVGAGPESVRNSAVGVRRLPDIADEKPLEHRVDPATLDDLRWADAVAWGTPTRNGSTCSARRAPAGTSVVEQVGVMEDGDVVAPFLSGEERAFTEIVARYQTRLLNFVYRTIGDRERAEDLVQDAFLRVYRHLHNFDQTKRFSTWIYTIAANLAKNELRNRSRYRLVLLEGMKRIWRGEELALELEDTSSRPDDLFHKRHLCVLVEEATTKLSAHHREVFLLRDVEGKSYEEIAEITGAKVGTVKSRLSRARESVAAYIEPWVD